MKMHPYVLPCVQTTEERSQKRPSDSSMGIHKLHLKIMSQRLGPSATIRTGYKAAYILSPVLMDEKANLENLKSQKMGQISV